MINIYIMYIYISIMVSLSYFRYNDKCATIQYTNSLYTLKYVLYRIILQDITHLVTPLFCHSGCIIIKSGQAMVNWVSLNFASPLCSWCPWY